MRRFRFTLEPALRHRQRLEEQAQIELAAQLRRLEHEHARAAALRLELQRHEEMRADLQLRSIEIGALTDAERYGAALVRAIAEQENRVAEALTAVEARRAAAAQRRTERESLDRLREQRLTEHRAEELRVEQKALDETSILRWRRG
jgi:flagellar export protein FliJ